MTVTRSLVRGVAATVIGIVALAGCGSDGDRSDAGGGSGADTAMLTIQDPWARDTAASQTPSAVYFTAVNDTGTDVVITGASVPASIAAEAQIHESMTDDSSMGDASGAMTTMREVPTVTVAAGDSVAFEPGGLHIMLTGLDHPLTIGEAFTARLTLRDGSTVPMTVTVRST